MKTITIDRSKWRTGGFDPDKATGKGVTRLLNGMGYKCCLGFICGAYKKKINGMAFPKATGCKIPHLTKLKDGIYVNTDLTTVAVAINDNWETTQAEKEAKLKELFEGKFNLKFVGEPTPYKDKK